MTALCKRVAASAWAQHGAPRPRAAVWGAQLRNVCAGSRHGRDVPAAPLRASWWRCVSGLAAQSAGDLRHAIPFPDAWAQAGLLGGDGARGRGGRGAGRAGSGGLWVRCCPFWRRSHGHLVPRRPTRRATMVSARSTYTYVTLPNKVDRKAVVTSESVTRRLVIVTVL